MKRITPEEVVEAYRATGLRPRTCSADYTVDGNCCAIGALAAFAELKAPVAWSQRVRQVAASMTGEFLLEDVRAIAEAEGLFPKSSNAWGSMATVLCQAGIIEWTGEYRRTKSVRTHAHPAKVWRVK